MITREMEMGSAMSSPLTSLSSLEDPDDRPHSPSRQSNVEIDESSAAQVLKCFLPANVY